MNQWKIEINRDTVDQYNKYYFSQHPRASKLQITKPIHPSINEWTILPRIQMNALKQKWKAFGYWIIKQYGYENLKLGNVDVVICLYFGTKRRHDIDNYTLKFLNDAFVESGFIVDDDDKHIRSVLVSTDYDKENPRTEIIFKERQE